MVDKDAIFYGAVQYHTDDSPPLGDGDEVNALPGRQGTPNQLYAYFVERRAPRWLLRPAVVFALATLSCKCPPISTQMKTHPPLRCQKLLAIVLCFSPIGDAWRSRIRQLLGSVRAWTGGNSLLVVPSVDGNVTQASGTVHLWLFRSINGAQPIDPLLLITAASSGHNKQSGSRRANGWCGQWRNQRIWLFNVVQDPTLSGSFRCEMNESIYSHKLVR